MIYLKKLFTIFAIQVDQQNRRISNDTIAYES